MADLSVIIPARNEIFLARTIEDIIANMRGDTEIIVILDGEKAVPSITDHPKVTIIEHSVSIGQRAASNEAVKISKAKYILKCDAHCAFDEGFDVKLMSDMHDDWTVVPTMKNLHVFDWVCKKCGDRRYQGTTPTECPKCDNKSDFERDIVWIAKDNPLSTSYCFDSEPHFQYFREFKSRPEGQGDLTETMSLQGSCFMLTRDKYWELNICDEEFGSWGSQGIEVACKTWLSGGRVVVNHKTWYAHMFRTKGGDFGFPYQISGRQTQHAKQYARELFFGNKWAKQKYPISWLIEKFWPVPGWTEEQLILLKKGDNDIIPYPQEITPASCLTNRNIIPKEVVRSSVENYPICSTFIDAPTKGMLYYTDNQCDEKITNIVREQLLRISEKNEIKIVSVSLQPIDFGQNIVLPLERSILTMFKQILTGLETLDTDIVYFCEHDVLYNEEHFTFIPPSKDKYYYNQNTWQVRLSDNYAVSWDCKKQSQLCGYREFLIRHYIERIRRIESEGFSRNMGFEPGTHHRDARVDDFKAEGWRSKIPNLDIRHGKNLTKSRWNQSEFRSQRNCRNWKESYINCIEGWEGLKL